jgi:hypothetical protein
VGNYSISLWSRECREGTDKMESSCHIIMMTQTKETQNTTGTLRARMLQEGFEMSSMEGGERTKDRAINAHIRRAEMKLEVEYRIGESYSGELGPCTS